MPTARDARPTWTLDDLKLAVAQAKHGKIEPTPKTPELLYLAHTRVPTTWGRQKVALDPMEWTRNKDGSLARERTLPNEVTITSKVVPGTASSSVSTSTPTWRGRWTRYAYPPAVHPNRLRSPTAERTFEAVPGVEAESAGVAPDADNPVTPELVESADVILDMEPAHRSKLAKQFPNALRGKRVVCLDVPDDYAYMDSALVELLWERVTRAVPALAIHKPV